MARPSRPQSAPVRAPLRAVRKILKFVGTPLDGVPMLQMETHRYDIELKSEDNETPVARAQNTGKILCRKVRAHPLLCEPWLQFLIAHSRKARRNILARDPPQCYNRDAYGRRRPRRPIRPP